MAATERLPRRVLAIAAHPDDIEFVMSGTLARLKQEAGAEIHMWNLCTGNCGTEDYSHDEIVAMRAQEARDSAAVLGAIIHAPVADDLELLYEVSHLRRIAAVVREVKPTIVLTHSPADYMEDHMNACRLAVTGLFSRGMRNFISEPPVEAWNAPVALYHAMPHGLRDGLRRLVWPELYVEVGQVLEIKRQMLRQHRSQKDWLDASQGMGSYVAEMEKLLAEMGRMSGHFDYAEAWRRHSHLGFAAEAAFDPLSDWLGDGVYRDPRNDNKIQEEGN